MMRILAVDNEQYALAGLVKAITVACPDAKIASFQTSTKALEYAAASPVDVAFLDIELGRISGLTLAQQLRELNPRLNIVFITGFSQYAVDAFSLYASDYILKPVRSEAVASALANLREKVEEPTRKSLFLVQCFGDFEVYVDNKRLYFPRSKSKELFAYLIHKRGGSCTTRELAAMLYEDRAYDRSVERQLQTIITTMMKTLVEVGHGDVVVRKRNSLAVDPRKVDCDYYKYIGIGGKSTTIYTGDYMSCYSWAEYTAGILSEML